VDVGSTTLNAAEKILAGDLDRQRIQLGPQATSKRTRGISRRSATIPASLQGTQIAPT